MTSAASWHRGSARAVLWRTDFFDLASGITSALLTAGQTYWFAATTVGLGGSGGYTVGGHTQNSDSINDNGTFWFSNDSSGLTFDGQALTPEMAFSVTVSAFPEPSTCALLGIALGMAGFMARRRSAMNAA